MGPNSPAVVRTHTTRARERERGERANNRIESIITLFHLQIHAKQQPAGRNPMYPAMAPPPTNNAQHRPPPPEAAEQRPSSHSIPMLLPVFLLFFFLVCFLSVFLFRDLLQYFSTTWLSGQRSGGTHRQDGHGSCEKDPGLDPAILDTFPTLPFSAVRRLQEGKCGGECPVCLSEFAGGDVIRFLTVCCHAFHPACIDSWLSTHTTCPICRSDLEAPPDEAAVLAVREAVGGGGGDSCSICIEEGHEKSHSIEIDGRGEGEGEEEEKNTIRMSGSEEEQTSANPPIPSTVEGDRVLDRAV